MTDVLLDVREHVAVITFNRPEAMNALRREGIEALTAHLRRVEADESLRALVLTGAGRAFCAGRDLKEVDALNTPAAPSEDVAAVVERYQELTRIVTRMPQVAIAAINGAAVGIGAELAAACDLRLATPNAKLSLPELRVGLFFTNGVLHTLPRIVGLGRASDWMLSGRMVLADELLASGFVSRLVQPEDLLPAALEVAAPMATYNVAATRHARALLAQSFALDLETTLRLEVDALVTAQHHDRVH